MSVLVTGSSGRIGRSVVSRLLAEGEVVRGLDRQPSGRTDPGFEETIGALDDRTAVASAMDGVSHVLHLGAYMSWAPGERDAMFAANVEGTRVLLEAAGAAKAERFVFASSGEVYPENAPVTLPVTEDHPTLPTSPYGLTKLLGEELVRFHGRSGAMGTVILRFSHTQDAEELLDETSFFSGPRFFLQARIRQQEAFGNREAAAALRAVDPGRPAHVLARNAAGRPFRMHITDTRDMVDGILLALRHPEARGETFNLGSSEPVDFATLLPAMAAETGLPLVEVDLPGAGVYYHTANDKIRRVLGFEPRWTIERMLTDAVAAMRRRSTAHPI